jgi:hypothetical protein
VVSGGFCCPGSPVTHKRSFNQDGTLAFSKSPDGYITYRKYGSVQLVMSIEDADTWITADIPSTPSGYSSSGAEIHRKVNYSVCVRRDGRTLTLNR